MRRDLVSCKGKCRLAIVLPILGTWLPLTEEGPEERKRGIQKGENAEGSAELQWTKTLTAEMNHLPPSEVHSEYSLRA